MPSFSAKTKIFLIVGAIFGALTVALLVYSKATKAHEREALANKIEHLNKADSNTIIYRLDPQSRHGDATNTENIFHGVGILGKGRTLEHHEAKALIDSLALAARNKAEPPDLCFNPGFGLSIQQAASSVDLLICFDCGQMRPFGFNRDKGIPITATPLPLFQKTARQMYGAAP